MKVLYGAYTERLVKALGDEGFGGELNYADCSAHLVPHAHAMARPYQLVLGGPAAAAISAAHLGEMIGDGNLLCADVGGTSADITVVVDGVPWSRNVFEIEHDMVVHAATVNVVTLGAGGGSIIAVTPEGDIATGPDSAGAQPGPACYGDGGDRPTVTDAAAMIGILSADGFLGGRKQLRLDLARQAFERLDTPLGLSERIRYGWEMAVESVAEGLRNIGIRRGIDHRDFSLVACGAAGPMLLPFLLDRFPVRRIVVPPHPGLFSALGLVGADRGYTDHRGRYPCSTRVPRRRSTSSTARWRPSSSPPSPTSTAPAWCGPSTGASSGRAGRCHWWRRRPARSTPRRSTPWSPGSAPPTRR